jgi:2-iminoacetate synthase
MSLAKRGKIGDCCAPNALMTLAEYLEDYGSIHSRNVATEVIAREIESIPSENIRRITAERLAMIAKGKRDFRF